MDAQAMTERQSDKTEGACEASINDLECGALAHYEELSKGARSWLSTIPRAIRFYFEAKRKAVAPENETWNEALKKAVKACEDRLGSLGNFNGTPDEIRDREAHEIARAISALKKAAPQAESPSVSDGQVGMPRAPSLPPAGAAPGTIMGGIASTPGARSGAYPAPGTSSETSIFAFPDGLGGMNNYVLVDEYRNLERELVEVRCWRDKAVHELVAARSARDRTAALLNEAVEENTRLRGATSGVLSSALLKDLVETRAFDQAIACTQSSYPDTASFIREWLNHYRADAVSATGALPK